MWCVGWIYWPSIPRIPTGAHLLDSLRKWKRWKPGMPIMFIDWQTIHFGCCGLFLYFVFIFCLMVFSLSGLLNDDATEHAGTRTTVLLNLCTRWHAGVALACVCACGVRCRTHSMTVSYSVEVLTTFCVGISSKVVFRLESVSLWICWIAWICCCLQCILYWFLKRCIEF